jgi:hypothetical protein
MRSRIRSARFTFSNSCAYTVCVIDALEWPSTRLTWSTSPSDSAIFQQPFSWRALGVDIRGRARTLRVNYRTSHQIRESADRLLDPEQTDADGNVESRAGTISVFNSAPPEIRVLDDEAAEADFV